MFTYSNKNRDIKLQYQLQSIARMNRKNLTLAENIMWNKLKNRQVCNLKFIRQYPLYKYIVDFYCYEHKLIIEIDGEYHDHQLIQDYFRDKYLQYHKYKILRFTNNDVINNIEKVIKQIESSLSC